MELYRALGSSVEAHKAVLAAHPMYANLMERALAKVVLQHVTTLEKFCQVLLLANQYRFVLCMQAQNWTKPQSQFMHSKLQTLGNTIL